MRKSVTQKLDYGCGVACFAFVCDLTFEQALAYLGKEYSIKHGWRPSDLVIALNSRGYEYKNNYVRKKPTKDYSEATIVLIERSLGYPVGHYLVLHNGKWMDPWINMKENINIYYAKSGFRTRLPGKAMYALSTNSS